MKNKFLKLFSIITALILILSNNIFAASYSADEGSAIGALIGFISAYGILLVILCIIPMIGYYKAFKKARIAGWLAIVGGLLFPIFTNYGKAKTSKCMWPFWIQIIGIPLILSLLISAGLGKGSGNDVLAGLTTGVGVMGILGIIVGFIIARLVLMIKFVNSFTNTDNVFIILIIALILTGGVLDCSFLVGYMNCNYKR